MTDGPLGSGPLDLPRLPPLGTPITVYRMVGNSPTLLAKIPNTVAGKAEAYLRRLSERYDLGPCVRGSIQVTRKELADGQIRSLNE